MNLQSLRDFVFRWNDAWPVDRWWRDKHKVAFNSPEHRVMNPIDIRIEYEEDRAFALYMKTEEQKYHPGHGNWLNKRSAKMTVEEVDDLFDRFDPLKHQPKDGKIVI